MTNILQTQNNTNNFQAIKYKIRKTSKKMKIVVFFSLGFLKSNNCYVIFKTLSIK